MGRPRKGFLFGSIRASKLGSVPIWSKPVGYDTVRKQFKVKLEELGLPEFDIHSARIGGATESSRKGAKREDIKTVGGWKSSEADTYIRPERPWQEVVKLAVVKCEGSGCF